MSDPIWTPGDWSKAKVKVVVLYDAKTRPWYSRFWRWLNRRSAVVAAYEVDGSKYTRL